MAFQARPGGILGEGRGAGGGHDVSCLPCEFKGAGWHNCPVLGTPASAVAAGGAGPSGARAHGGGHGAECPRASAPSSPPQPGPSAACRTSQVMTLGDSVGRTHLGGRRWLSSPPEACTASSALGPPSQGPTVPRPGREAVLGRTLGSRATRCSPRARACSSLPRLTVLYVGSLVPARHLSSPREWKGHPGQPGRSPEPHGSSVLLGPQTCQGPGQSPSSRGSPPSHDPWLALVSWLGTPEPHSSPHQPGSVTLKPWSPGLSSSSSSDSVWPLGKPDGPLARGCGFDLINRYCGCLGGGAGLGVGCGGMDGVVGVQCGVGWWEEGQAPAAGRQWGVGGSSS